MQSVTRTIIPADTENEIDQLAVLLKVIRGTCIVFAIYHADDERKIIVSELRKRGSAPIREIFLSEKRKDIIGLLVSMSDEKQHQDAALFLYNLELTFPESLGNLNLQRETLSTIPFKLVFWVRENALREIAEKAPDFWAWRSEVFDFRFVKAELAGPISTLGINEKRFIDKNQDEIARRINLYEEILTQNEHEKKPEMRTIAFLSDKLAEMHYYSGDFEHAEKYWEKCADIYKQVDDRSGLAICLWNQGIIFSKKGNKKKQIELWQKSIDLNKSIGIPTDKYEQELSKL